MSGFKLWDIDQFLRDAIAAAEDKIDSETGEVPADWDEFLGAIEMERNDKALAVAAYVKERRAEADAVALEAGTLRNRARSLNNCADRLQGYLSRYLQPGEKIADARTVISWRKSSAVVVDREGGLPDSCWKVEKSVLKTAVKAALENKEIGPEIAHIEIRQNLQIK